LARQHEARRRDRRVAVVSLSALQTQQREWVKPVPRHYSQRPQ
jgi:hypothetical protein